jgi:hypothetical protein
MALKTRKREFETDFHLISSWGSLVFTLEFIIWGIIPFIGISFMYLFLVITYDNAIYCGLFSYLFFFFFSFFKGCGRSGALRDELTFFLIDYIAVFMSSM